MPFANQSLDASHRYLDQAVELLDRLDDRQYADRRGDWSPVGAQYRHVIEHYQCLIAGASAGRVDYDARRRDPAIELSRSFAREVTLEIRDQLHQLAALPASQPIAVQIRSAEDAEGSEWSESTLGRELQFVVSHTVHHFALIKLLLQPDGVAVPTDFGTAPSTLAHARAQR
jgi:hypothetical protein